MMKKHRTSDLWSQQLDKLALDTTLMVSHCYMVFPIQGKKGISGIILYLGLVQVQQKHPIIVWGDTELLQGVVRDGFSWVSHKWAKATVK